MVRHDDNVPISPGLMSRHIFEVERRNDDDDKATRLLHYCVGSASSWVGRALIIPCGFTKKRHSEYDEEFNNIPDFKELMSRHISEVERRNDDDDKATRLLHSCVGSASSCVGRALIIPCGFTKKCHSEYDEEFNNIPDFKEFWGKVYERRDKSDRLCELGSCISLSTVGHRLLAVDYFIVVPRNVKVFNGGHTRAAQDLLLRMYRSIFAHVRANKIDIIGLPLLKGCFKTSEGDDRGVTAECNIAFFLEARPEFDDAQLVVRLIFENEDLLVEVIDGLRRYLRGNFNWPPKHAMPPLNDSQPPGSSRHRTSKTQSERQDDEPQPVWKQLAAQRALRASSMNTNDDAM